MDAHLGGVGCDAAPPRGTIGINIALGHWIVALANQRAQRTGEDTVTAVGWAVDWVDTQQGAYRVLGAPYGAHDDGLLRWLHDLYPHV